MFKDIIGHQQPLKILRRSIHSGRLPHGYLFVGPPNVGKTFVALQFAKALNCERIDPEAEPDELDCCNQCESCRHFDLGNHPDFMMLWPRTKDTKKKRNGDDEDEPEDEEQPLEIEGTMIQTGQVERLVQHANVKRSIGRQKVYIVTSAETMNGFAANRLLKTLEEPPPDTILILTASNVAGLLPTIISRCQMVKFTPVTQAEAEQRLAERYPDTPEGELRVIVALSNGRVGWAINMLRYPAVFELRKDLLDLCQRLPGMPMVQSLQVGEKLIAAAEQWWLATNTAQDGERALKSYRDRVLRTRMHDILDVLIVWFRDLMVMIGDPQSELIANMDRRAELQRTAGRYTLQSCQRVCMYLEEMKRQLRQNANLRLAAEMAALRMLSAAPSAA